jgi:hypothetical protein
MLAEIAGGFLGIPLEDETAHRARTLTRSLDIVANAILFATSETSAQLPVEKRVETRFGAS